MPNGQLNACAVMDGQSGSRDLLEELRLRKAALQAVELARDFDQLLGILDRTLEQVGERDAKTFEHVSNARAAAVKGVASSELLVQLLQQPDESPGA
jgi:hypothetical protein